MLRCWDTDELQSQRSAIGSNVSAVKSLEARAASSSEEGAMLRARLNDMTRERVRLSKTSPPAFLKSLNLIPPHPPWLGDLTPVCPSLLCARLYCEQDSLLRMLGEERSHVTELERIIEAARAR